MSSNFDLKRVVAGVALATLAMQSSLAQDGASAPSGRAVAGVAHVQAQVVGIDPAANSVMLKGPSGRVAEIAVNPQIGDVTKLRIGDTVNIDYRSALLVRATKGKPGAVRERIETQAAIPASGGVTAQARTVEILATIQRIDTKERTLTLRGPDRTVTFAVAPEVSLEGLKTGDSVHAMFESATAVQVTRDGQPIK